MTTALARCSIDLSCPVRFRYGPSRPCAEHANQDGDILSAARELGITMSTAPGFNDTSADGSSPSLDGEPASNGRTSGKDQPAGNRQTVSLPASR